jgi:hypothetical protein
MKKMMVALLAGAMLMMATSAMATSFSGALWQGTSADTYANNPIAGPPAFSASATFTVDDINFDSRRGGGANNTYQKFLQGDASSNINNLQWVTGSSLANTFYTSSGFHGSFFDIQGIAYFDGTVDVWHDDGFALILKQNGNLKYTFNYSTPVSPTLNTLTLTAGLYDFEVRYGATNSFPEVLTIDGMSAPVPEPGTMLLLGLGLMGVAGIRRFKK